MIDDSFRGMTSTDSYKLFKNFVKKGCKGKTVIFASSNYRFLHLSTHFLYMDDGKIVESGEKKKLSRYEEFDGIDLDENSVRKTLIFCNFFLG